MPGGPALEPRPCHWLGWSTGFTLGCAWSTSRDAETADEFGQIDVLVNNAAFQRTYDEPEEVPDEDWDRYFQTNVPAMYHLCKPARRRFVMPGKTRKRQEREAQFDALKDNGFHASTAGPKSETLAIGRWGYLASVPGNKGVMSRRETSAVTAPYVVEVEFVGASYAALLRHLGSLTERHAMRMEIISSNSSTTSRTRVRITVPHAADRREAEETVASLVEWTRRVGNYRSSQFGLDS